jgi:hypothetical protein
MGIMFWGLLIRGAYYLFAFGILSFMLRRERRLNMFEQNICRIELFVNFSGILKKWRRDQ